MVDRTAALHSPLATPAGICLLAVAALALLLVPDLSGGTRQPPVELWQEYPLDEDEPQQSTPAPNEPQQSTPAPQDQPGPLTPPAQAPTPERIVVVEPGSPTWLRALAGFAGAGVLAYVVARRVRVRGRRGDHAPEAAESTAATGTTETTETTATAEKGAPEMGKFWLRLEPRGPAAADSKIPLMDMSAYSLMERSNDMDEHEDRAESAEPDAARQTVPASFGEVGTHVASVLQAAQESADRIVSAARERAAKLVEDAGAQAKQRLADARGEEERISSEVARLRGEAESYAATRREEVEQELQALRSRAEQEARDLREAAEQLRDRIEREAEERQARLRDLERDVEDRLREAWVTARDVGARIGSLLEGRGAPEDAPTRRDESLIS